MLSSVPESWALISYSGKNDRESSNMATDFIQWVFATENNFSERLLHLFAILQRSSLIPPSADGYIIDPNS